MWEPPFLGHQYDDTPVMVSVLYWKKKKKKNCATGEKLSRLQTKFKCANSMLYG